MNYQSLLETPLTEFSKEHPAPQTVCGVCKDGELLAIGSANATGFAELAKPSHASFRIASMTKCFAAAAILKLRDEGRLQLERSAADYLPELALTGRWREVTVRQLLSMRSGLPAADDPWADRKLSESDAFLTSGLLNSAHFSNDPDEEYQYSNLGYMVLGRIISNVAQQHALQYISEAFLAPLGMTQTTWNLPAEDSAGGYRPTPRGFASETAFRAQSDLAVFGGICSTLADMALWVNFMVDAHRTQSVQLEPVLSARSRREMQRAQVVMHPISSAEIENRPIGYGYGLRANYIGNEWFIGHSGGLPGYGSHMSWSPTRGIGVIALGNATYFAAPELCKEILIAIQGRSSRRMAHLAHGVQIVVSRGKDLVEAILGDATGLPGELFAYNFPADEELETLLDRLRGALQEAQRTSIEVRAERGFAGAIYAGDKPLVFYSLAPVEDYRIQKISFYPTAPVDAQP